LQLAWNGFQFNWEMTSILSIPTIGYVQSYLIRELWNQMF
jgi:hypothetical protein